MKKGVRCGLFSLFAFLFASSAQADITQDLSDIRNHILAKQFSQAEQKLVTITRESPNNVDTLFLLSVVQMQLGKWRESETTLRHLISNDANIPEAYNNLALVEAKRGDFDKAIENLQNGLKTQNAYVVLYDNLSKIYAYKASQAYLKILEGNSSANSTSLSLELQPIDVTKWSTKTAASPAPIVATSSAEVPPNRDSDAKTDLESARNTLLTMVTNWAGAWSDKNVSQYLSFYDDRFQTPQSIDRNLWEKQRRDRILGPKFIKVEISSPIIEMSEDGSLASVTFSQFYRSDNFNQRTKKILVMRRKGTEWRILSEYNES